MALDSPLKHAMSAESHLNHSLDTGDTHSEASFQSNASSSHEQLSPSHPFSRLPTHPLILPSSVLNQKVKPGHFQEAWDAVNVKLFIVEVMGALPTTHDYHKGIHLCRAIFVSKYGFGRYMDNMSLFWGMFHDTYVGRDSDPHSASWSRWRYDRRVELEHVLCHSYVWGSNDGGNYLEEYINFKPGEPGRTYVEDQKYLRIFGAKVTRFEVGWIGIENCNPEWGEENVKMRGSLGSTTSRGFIPRISSPRLSSEFVPSMGSANDDPPLLTAAQQWESANHTHALNVFAARRHRTLSQNGGKELQQETEQAFSIHRPHSVWKETKQLLLQRSHSRKKRVVSAPVHVNRGPSLGVTLLPIASPAPELSKRFRNTGTLQFNQAPHRSSIPDSDTESTLWRLVSLLPQSFQGSLYGQLEDLLVFSVNKFLRFQASSLREESILKELEIMERGSDSWMQPSESSDKTWFRQLRGRIISLRKARNCSERKGVTWLNSHEWGVMPGYRLTHANVGTLQFHGDNAASPTSVLGLWSQLISEAFSGGRTTFDDRTVMRHLDHVESILDLLGDLVMLRELKKKKHEIRMLLKCSTAPEIAEGSPSFTEIPQRRAPTPPGVLFPPIRSSSLPSLLKVNRPQSVHSSMDAVWSELGGSYATTPSLPPLGAEDMENSPCHGKGKRRARTLNKVEGVKSTRTAGSKWDTIPNRDTEDVQRKENERANTIQTLVGKQVPVAIATMMGAGTRKEVRFQDIEK